MTTTNSMKNDSEKTDNLTLLSLRIRQLRKEKKMHQRELAEKLGVTTGTISNYENGVIVPPTAKLRGLSRIFEVPMDYITGESTSRIYADEKQYSHVDHYVEELITALDDPSEILKFGDYPIPANAREIFKMNMEHSLNILRKQVESSFNIIPNQ